MLRMVQVGPAMLERVAQTLVRRRRGVLAVTLLVTLVAAVLALRLEFDFTPRVLYAGHGDMVEFSEAFKQQFGYEDAMLLVVVEATGEADVCTPPLLNWQHAAATRLAAVSGVEQVVCLATLKLPRARLLRTTHLLAESLFPTWPVDAAAAAHGRKVLDHYELVQKTLVSADYRAALMICRVQPTMRDIHRLRPVVAKIRQTFAATELPPGYRLHFQGLPAIRTEIVSELIQDQTRLLPLVGVLFFIILRVIYRPWSAAALPLVASAVGLIWTVAVLVLLGQTLNIVSNVLPILLFIIAVSNCVHVVGRYSEECDAGHGSPEAAAASTIAHMTVPCFLTYLTTAIGFGSLVFAESEGLKSFGWQSALGMVLCYFSTLIVLGALMPLCPRPIHDGAAFRGTEWFMQCIAAATRHSLRYVVVCFLITGVALTYSIAVGLGVPLNSYLVETYDQDHPTIQAMHLVDDKLGGFVPLEISLDADSPARFTEPDVLRRVAAAQSFAVSRREVISARSYLDVLQTIHRSSRPTAEPLDDPKLDTELAAGRIRRAQRLALQVADIVGYHNFLSQDGHRARVLLRMRDVGSQQTLLLSQAIEQRLRELFPPGTGITFRLTGDAYLNARAMDGFVRSMFSSLLGAAAIIFFVIGLLFRSVRLGLIAVLPNVTPLVLTFGYMGWRGYELNVTNAIVFSISLGVAVDNTVHYLSRFLEEMALEWDVGRAVRHVLGTAGRTMAFTSVLIVGGLAILLVSDFLPTRRFAELTAVTMGVALAGDLLILPACVLAFYPQRAPETIPARAAAVAE